MTRRRELELTFEVVNAPISAIPLGLTTWERVRPEACHSLSWPEGMGAGEKERDAIEQEGKGRRGEVDV